MRGRYHGLLLYDGKLKLGPSVCHLFTDRLQLCFCIAPWQLVHGTLGAHGIRPRCEADEADL